MRIATINVNGVRAAFRKGMADWVVNSGCDVLALQEVRADTADLVDLFGDGWHIVHDAASQKGRAGVALVSKIPLHTHRTELGPDDLDTAGRWLEADLTTPQGHSLTVVSAYVHSGEAGTPKQDAKYAFLEVMDQRMAALGRERFALVLGDLNVGHRTLDIKNWKGNLKNAGFLPEERAHFDTWLGAEGSAGYNTGEDGRFVDIGRRFHGEVDGPYTWWSYRGKAFDTNAGWRIDYHLATKALSETLQDYRVDRAPSYDSRWSDHSPVVADYNL